MREPLSLSSKLLLLVISVFTVSFGPLTAHAVRLRCADSQVAFEYEDAKEIKCVCETAKATIIFLKTLGLATTEVVTIKLVDNLPSHQSSHLIGYYDPASREVNLLTYSKTVELSQSNRSFLRIDVSKDIWCSYAAHELAHAISSQYLLPESNNHTAGEYISAVTQLSVLAPESREKILKKYKIVEAYKSMSEISILYFLFAPNEFAVKCYLHFISLDDPKEFIERLLKTDDEIWERF